MTPLASCFRKNLPMAERPQLHLVSTEGAAVNPAIQEAVELAYHWVEKDFPSLDRAQLADWAEAVGQSMQSRGSDIRSLKRYAYAALRGRVVDWFRTGAAQEQSAGVSRDLERIGGASNSFQSSVDRKILLEQVQGNLQQRDQDILGFLLNDDDARKIARELNTTYPAARKAIQRVRERIAAIVDPAPSTPNGSAPKRRDVDRRDFAVER